MIDNYLSYVKRLRQSAIERARHYSALSRVNANDWINGFYRGHAQAASFEARSWRHLQKDIEAVRSKVDCLNPFDSLDAIFSRFSI